MKTLVLVVLVGISVVLTLKLVSAVLAVVLPLVLVAAVLAIPVFFVVGVGWAVSTLWRGAPSRAR